MLPDPICEQDQQLNMDYIAKKGSDIAYFVAGNNHLLYDGGPALMAKVSKGDAWGSRSNNTRPNFLDMEEIAI